MERHAVENTIVIDAKDKESIVEWFEQTEFKIRVLRGKLKDYPDRKLYRILV